MAEVEIGELVDMVDRLKQERKGAEEETLRDDGLR